MQDEKHIQSMQDTTIQDPTIQDTNSLKNKEESIPEALVHELKDGIQELHLEITKLSSHRLLRMYDSFIRLLGIQFMKGIAFGLGSVLGATLIVSLFISFLSQIEFIPLIGEWAKQIIIEIQSTKN